MSDIIIKSPKTGREMSVSYNFGADHDEAVQLFTAEVVFSKFTSQACTDLGNRVRVMLNEKDEDGNPTRTEVDILAFIADYKPGVVTRGVGKKKESVDSLIAELENPDTTEERIQVIVGKLKVYSDDAKKAATALKNH